MATINVLTNSGLDTDLADWTISTANGATATHSAGEVILYRGTHDFTPMFYQTHTLTAGIEYTLTFDVIALDLRVGFYVVHADTLVELARVVEPTTTGTGFTASFTPTETKEYRIGSIPAGDHNIYATVDNLTLTYNGELLTTDTDPFNDGSLLSGLNFNNTMDNYVDILKNATKTTNVLYSTARFDTGAEMADISAIYTQDTLVEVDKVDLPFSLCIWYERKGIAGSGSGYGGDVHPLIATGDSIATRTFEASVNYDDNTLVIQLISDGVTDRYVFTTDVIPFSLLTGFHNYTIVYDGSKTSDGLSVYVDGISIAYTVAMYGTYTGMDVLPLILGQTLITDTNYHRYSIGIFDQYMALDRTLTDEEVTELYNMEEPPPPPSTGLALFFNGVTTTQVFFNGVELTEAYFNGAQLQ